MKTKTKTPKCYACDAIATGKRHRPEGGSSRSACERHADPETLPAVRELRRHMARLARKRAKLNAAQAALNEEVYQASAGKAHNQGCRLGGLFTGMAADASGRACWCGQSELEAAKRAS
jgi:hypothetical protein